MVKVWERFKNLNGETLFKCCYCNRSSWSDFNYCPACHNRMITRDSAKIKIDYNLNPLRKAKRNSASIYRYSMLRARSEAELRQRAKKMEALNGKA